MAFATIFRVVIGLVLIAEGVDKFYNKLAEWQVYTAPQILDLLPITHSEFLGILGITEVIVGIIFLFKARYGGLLAALLLAAVTTNLLMLGSYYNIALLNTIVALVCLSISQAGYFRKPPPMPPPIV